MNLNYIKCYIQDVDELLKTYLNSLKCVVDDFWEYHILDGEFYKIIELDIIIGCFCIFNSEKITMFTVKSDYLFMARDIFKDVLKTFEVKTGFAVTGDELMLSLCMENHAKIEMQAIFFNGEIKHNIRSPEYERSCLSEINPHDIDKINSETDNFFSFATVDSIINKTHMIYKLVFDGGILGYGIIVPNVLLKKYWACGMITLEQYRKKGVGRSIQIHLGDICRENNKIPISGCWYYNDLSKKTIESAGRYTTTRLLNVIF